MSKPKAPPAPDYAAAAQAQGVANVEAARTGARLSNPNITNPYGTQTVRFGGEQVFDEAGYNSALQAYNSGSGPRNAQTFDAQRYLSENPDVAASAQYRNNPYLHYQQWGQNEGRNAAFNAPTREMFTTASDPDRVDITQTLSPEQQALFDQENRISQGLGNLAEGGIDRVGQMLGTSFDSSNLPAFTGSISPQNVQSRSGQVQSSIAPTAASITSEIAPTNTQLQSTIADPRQQVQYGFGQPTNAVQGSVDPRFDQSGDQVQQALYRKQTSMLDPQYQQQESDMVSRLANQGIMPGSEAYNREMNNFARQRDFAYGNARDSAILASGSEQSRLNEMGLSRANLANTANNQEFTQGLSRTQLANLANSQEFGQNAQRASFNNDTQGQEFMQNATRAGFQNEAQAQQFGQNAQQLAANNAAIAQMFGQDLSAAGQNFGQQQSAAQFGNTSRQNALQEALTLRQLPLSEINALRTGAQPTIPQFQGYTGQNVAAAPVFQAAGAQDQANMARYNAQAAQAGNTMSGLFSMGAAALPLLSDRRAKENIRRIGRTDGGLLVYTYNYKGSAVRQMGVMAQDVEKVDPSAVVEHSSGFKMVDYSKVM